MVPGGDDRTAVRVAMVSMNARIAGGRPHCMICADTEDECPLRCVKGMGTLCVDCIRIQSAMT